MAYIPYSSTSDAFEIIRAMQDSAKADGWAVYRIGKAEISCECNGGIFYWHIVTGWDQGGFEPTTSQLRSFIEDPPLSIAR